MADFPRPRQPRPAHTQAPAPLAPHGQPGGPDPEVLLRAVVAATQDAVIALDALATVQTFSSAAERLFGYDAKEVVGRPIATLVAAGSSVAVQAEALPTQAPTETAADGGEDRDVIGLRKNGSTFPARLRSAPIGQHGHALWLLRDLTTYRQLECRVAESRAEERASVARTLHDDVGGHVVGAGLLALALSADLRDAGSPFAARAAALAETISEVHHRMRAVVRGFMPMDLPPEGLSAALERLARDVEARHQVTCECRCDTAVVPAGPFTATHLFHIAQEAVNNAIRHAAPTRVTLRLAWNAAAVELEVTDDGSGFSAAPPGHDGVGLDSMRQRARLLGGTCVVQPRTGGGTTVRCSIPITTEHGRETPQQTSL